MRGVPAVNSVTVRAPAKVNLQLVVGARRADGFHDVATAYHAVSLYDEVTVSAGSGRSVAGITVEVVGEDAAGVPADATNLAVRAAALLAQHSGVEPRAHLLVRKGIPVAGGMAGGSADAAAALLACDAFWRTGLSRDALVMLAGRLGSDVPFALHGGTAVGTGRGERLTRALSRGRYDWVFAVAETGLPTPAVYAELDRLRGSALVLEPRVSDGLMAALRTGDPVALGRAMTNDLQPAACSLRPPLRTTLETGAEFGSLGAMVSGSGPTCAFLVRDAEHGLDLAVALMAMGACRSVKRATGPVPGARVVDTSPPRGT